MRIAMLSPIAWRTPPRKYGPWESVASLLTEGLIQNGIDVTLFATGDSITKGTLSSVCKKGYEEDKSINVKATESLHISSLFEQGDEFDLIHNHFDYLPLTYSKMTTTPVLTTIHGFSSPSIIPVYEKYNNSCHYISISNADRADSLDYLATVYNGIQCDQFPFQNKAQQYLLFLGRIHNDKGTREAIEIAKSVNIKLIIAGPVQGKEYFSKYVEPHLNQQHVEFVGMVGPEQRNTLLGNALALLHPIQFDEPFGLTVVESMACGTPVIAFNRGSMPELIEDGLNGFLVDDVAGAAEAVGQLNQINRYACRKHVESNFSAELMVQGYLSAYQQLLENTARESHRPWGYYKTLSDSNIYKAKEIVVFPGKKLSLQRHKKRDEHWLVLDGSADITCGTKHIMLETGQSIDIPRNVIHRIHNPNSLKPLKIIEVQTGCYFGEDDIERIENDFGRAVKL